MKIRMLCGLNPVLFLFICFFAVGAYASDISAASCSQASVQSAASSAADGDRVLVPAGTCSWTTPVSFCKAITLQGAGIGSTVITSNVGTGFGKDAIYVANCQNKSLIRITGFTFQNQSTDSYGLIFFYLSGSTTFRIDHNAFLANGNLNRAITISGQTFGVIDHNTITDLGILIENRQAGETNPGDTSWTQAMSLGTANSVYLEDNTMNYSTNSVDLDCDDGGRVVYRYNAITGNGIGNHGFDSVPRGCMELDAYNNTIIAGATAYIGIQYRGGTGVVYNNLLQGTFSGYRFAVTNYRSTSLGFTIYPYCNGTSSYDQNQAPMTSNFGAACRDQIGRGTNQSSFPLYEWNNCVTSLGCTPGGSNAASITVYQAFGGTSYLSQHIQANRDYFDAVASFAGTNGIGQGSLAVRPGTCKPGVGYWASDNNTLYTCSTANTWATYYSQFSYPHPLLLYGQTQVQPPTGLSASAN